GRVPSASADRSGAGRGAGSGAGSRLGAGRPSSAGGGASFGFSMSKGERSVGGTGGNSRSIFGSSGPSGARSRSVGPMPSGFSPFSSSSAGDCRGLACNSACQFGASGLGHPQPGGKGRQQVG